jgi:hypothetical protein
MEGQPNLNIKILIDGNFCDANEHQQKAYMDYKQNSNNSYHYKKDDIVFDIKRSGHGYFYLVGPDKTQSIMIAEYDIRKRFKFGKIVKWVEPHPEQKEAFLYFIRSNIDELFVYSSKVNTIHIDKNKNYYILPSKFDKYTNEHTRFKMSKDVNCIKCTYHHGGYTYITADLLHMDKFAINNIILMAELCVTCCYNDSDYILLPC